MSVFFENIWAWISAHSAQIAAVLTPANLVLVIGALVQLFKQKKTIVYNTSSSADLKKSLQENKAIKEQTEGLTKEVAALKALSGEISDQLSQSLVKLNAVLSVQESAYNASNLPKETLVTIHNLIANGRFAESKSRVAIGEEMAALKEKIAALMAAGEASEKRMKKLTGTEEKQPESAEKTAAVRYD